MKRIGLHGIQQWPAVAVLVWLLLTTGWLFVRSDGMGGRPLVTTWSYDPGLYDPHRTTDPVAYSVFRHVCEPLFYEDFTGNARGLLAEDEVEYQDGGQRLIIRLRSNIVFHDGWVLDAAAVQHSFARLRQAGLSPLLDDLKDVALVVRDARTVEFQLPAPDYDFIRLMLSNPYAVIVSPGSSVTNTPGFVACTGPYQFTDRLYHPTQSLTLVRYAEYQWPPAYFNNRGPAYIHQLHFAFQADAEKRLEALLTEAGCMLSIAPEHLPSVTARPEFHLHKAIGGVTYLGFNFLQPRWQDVRIRQAIAMSINKAALAATGPFDVAHTPLSPAMTGYDARVAIDGYEYDPVQSRQQLQAAGFDFTAEIVLLLPQSNTYRRLADRIVPQLAAVGIDRVRLREAPRAEISSQRQQFDLLIFDYAWGDYTALAIFLGPGPRNLLAYPTGDIVGLIKQARRAATAEQRRTFIHNAQQIVLKDAVWQPLVVRNITFAVDRRCVQGERQSPFGELLFHDAWTW